MGRYPKVQEMKQQKKKGGWSEEEDKKLTEFINNHGLQGYNWETISHKAGLNRCGKSCRLRWKNYLSPLIRRGNISKEEESIIILLHSRLGNKWSEIAIQLPGRTDNDIKNFWNTKLRKKLIRNQKLASRTVYSSQPQTPTTEDHIRNFLANYIISTLSIFLGFIDMQPQPGMAQNLQQVIMAMASTPNFTFLPDPGLGNELDNENSTIPFEFEANLASDPWFGYGSIVNSFNSNVGDMCSYNDLTDPHHMLPALVSATDDEIPMPMTHDGIYVDPNSQASFDCNRIADETVYMNPDLGSAVQEGFSASNIYVGASSSFYDD